jgi:hypothetical protein
MSDTTHTTNDGASNMTTMPETHAVIDTFILGRHEVTIHSRTTADGVTLYRYEMWEMTDDGKFVGEDKGARWFTKLNSCIELAKYWASN